MYMNNKCSICGQTQIAEIDNGITSYFCPDHKPTEYEDMANFLIID